MNRWIASMSLFCALSFACTSYAVVIGDFETGLDGWVPNDWDTPATRIATAEIGATSGTKSLQITDASAGWQAVVKLSLADFLDAYMASATIEMDVTFNPSDWIGDTGWVTLGLVVNSETGGWLDQGAPDSDDVNLDAPGGWDPVTFPTLQTRHLVWDITDTLPALVDGPGGWFELFLISNWDGFLGGSFYIDNVQLVAVEVEPEPVKPVAACLVHSYTFEDGTANDSVGTANGTLVGDANVVDGSLVLDGDGDWMSMPGDVLALNTLSELSIEARFTSVAGGNTGFHMIAAFGEEGTGAATWAGYKYLFISPARGDDVSRAAIQTMSMDDSPWTEETGVSATVEHDDGLQHHFVCTVSATDLAFYIDGELIGSVPLPEGNAISGISQSVAYLGKGVYPADPLWKGSIQEFNIYNKALTIGEVLWLAGRRPVPVDPGPDNLMVYYPLDNDANDYSGNAHNGTILGDSHFVEGVAGTGMEFDGAGDYVDTGYADNLATWTVSCWAKSPAAPSSGSPSGPLHRERNYQINWNHSQDAFRAAVGMNTANGWFAAKFGTLQADTWYHLLGTYDGEKIKAFLNGELIAINTSPSGPANAETNSLKLGRHASSSSQFFTGTVDQVRVFDRPLSGGEIRYLTGYRESADPGVENLAAYYPFDTDANDASGNGYNGTFLFDAHVADGVLVLDGTDDAVAIPRIGGASAVFGQTTYSLWVYPTTDQTTLQFCGGINRDVWATGAIHFKMSYGKVNVGISGAGNDVQGTTIVQAGEWSHMGLTVTDDAISVYLNGSLEASRALDAPLSTLILGDGAIGAWNQNGGGTSSAVQREMTGYIDEVRIYDRGLSAAEINYLAGDVLVVP